MEWIILVYFSCFLFSFLVPELLGGYERNVLPFFHTGANAQQTNDEKLDKTIDTTALYRTLKPTEFGVLVVYIV